MPIARSLSTNLLSVSEIGSPNTVPKTKPKAKSSNNVIKQARTRSLRFAKYDEVLEIPHIDDLCDEEVEDVWISPEEFKDMRRRARHIVSLIEDDADTISSGNLCSRGLDRHTERQVSEREAVQDLIYETVFRIQSFQSEKNLDARDLMGGLCQKYSAVSVASALEIAQKDAVEAIVDG